jgi:hypothetical protein
MQRGGLIVMSAGKYIMDKFGNLLQVEYGGDGKIERKTVIVERPSQLIINFEDPNFNLPAYETELRSSLAWFAVEMEKRLRDKDEEKGITGWQHNEVLMSAWFNLTVKLTQLNQSVLEGQHSNTDPIKILRYAVDAANWLMIIADIARSKVTIKEGYEYTCLKCGHARLWENNKYVCHICKANEANPTIPVIDTALMHKHTDNPPCVKCGTLTVGINGIDVCVNYDCADYDEDRLATLVKNG